MLDIVRLFSPPVPPLLFVSPERFFSPILGILFTLYPLNFFTCFVYSLASLTVQFFVDGIMMSSFFTPRGARCRSTAPRHPASARALSLSLLLGLSPLAGITPAALATPAQATPEQQAQPAQATPASPAATQEDADEPTYSLPEVDESRHPEMEGFTVSPETLNITRGGTVTLTTPPLSAEFRQNYEFYEFSLVDRGSSYFKAAHARIDGYAYFGYLFDREPNPKQMVENPDGSYTFFLNIGPYIIEANEGTLFDVILTYHKKGHREDFWPSEFRFVARAPINVVQDPKPTETTYIFSVPAIDDPWKDTTLTIEGFHILTSGSREGKDGPALLAFYEVDPKTGKIVGEPEFTTRIPYPASRSGERVYFLNWHFKTSITISGGTLKPGKVYKIGFYGSNLPHPGEEEYSGSLLASVAQFLPVRSGQPSDNQPNPDQPVARPDLYIPYKRVNPYQEMNTLTARVSNLPKLTDGHYRFSVQATDDSGEPTGEKALEQVIPAEHLLNGSTDEKLNIPGSALNYEGSYGVVLEKVIPGKNGAADAVEQVTSEGLELFVSYTAEREAAVEWVKQQVLLDESKTVLSRRDVTVALYRLAGAPHVELPATSPYADVTPDDPDYAAIVWARQKGITFGWVDGKFHPEVNLSIASTVAFLYRYQRALTPASSPESSSLPSSPVPKSDTSDSSNVPEESPTRDSRSRVHWPEYERMDTAFWRESLWATQQIIWGYAEYYRGHGEDFSSDTVSSSEFSVMLYRMTHGGSRLK